MRGEKVTPYAIYPCFFFIRIKSWLTHRGYPNCLRYGVLKAWSKLKVISKFARGKWLPRLVGLAKKSLLVRERENQPACPWSYTGLQIGKAHQVILLQRRLAEKLWSQSKRNKSVNYRLSVPMEQMDFNASCRDLSYMRIWYIFYCSFLVFYSWNTGVFQTWSSTLQH